LGAEEKFPYTEMMVVKYGSGFPENEEKYRKHENNRAYAAQFNDGFDERFTRNGPQGPLGKYFIV
jgi:hypothetical protein